MKAVMGFGDKATPLPDIIKSHWEDRPVWKQTHSTTMKWVDRKKSDCGECDAMFTDSKNVPLFVKTADCVPILLHSKSAHAIGVIHAGWRGALDQIITKSWNELPEASKYATDWEAWVGPSIRVCCFEVQEDVKIPFLKRFAKIPPIKLSPRPDRVDLLTVIEHELKSIQVRQIHVTPECTMCMGAPQFKYNSFRRDQTPDRQISGIILV